MREIKFRVWLKDEKQMEDIHSLNFPFDRKSGKHMSIKVDDCYEWRSIDEVELLQYTGLKDKNGVEIYEGDIVLGGHESVYNKTMVVCYDINQTKYKTVPKSTYYANAGNGGWTGFDLRWYCEVVGNIFENPELLNA